MYLICSPNLLSEMLYIKKQIATHYRPSCPEPIIWGIMRRTSGGWMVNILWQGLGLGDYCYMQHDGRLHISGLVGANFNTCPRHERKDYQTEIEAKAKSKD